MTDEQKLQYLKATALLENQQALQRAGRGDSKQVADLQRVVAQYKGNYQKTVEVLAPSQVQPGFVQHLPQQSLPPEVCLIVDKLRAEQQQIDHQKNQLADSLYAIPDTVNCRALVQEIKSLREEWAGKGDQIRFVMQYGALPDAPAVTQFDGSQFVQALPQDLLDLDKKMKNRACDLSKYRKRLQEAKTQVSRATQERNIAQAEMEISIMKTEFNARRK